MGGGSSHTTYETRVVTVTREVIKTVDVQELRYNEDQRVLAKLLDAAFAELMPSAAADTAASIGRKGTGKSTTLNAFFGTHFDARETVADCTQELTVELVEARSVVDTVGVLPSSANLGKLLLLFCIRHVLPDYFVMPVGAGRLDELDGLGAFVTSGFVRVILVPFNARTYYTLKEEGVADSVARQRALGLETKAIAAGAAADAVLPHVKEMAAFVEHKAWTGNVVVYSGVEDAVPRPSGSMRQRFLTAFSQDGKFKTVPYSDHVRAMAAGDASAALRALLLEAAAALRESGALRPDAGATVVAMIPALNEVTFLRG